MRNPIIAVGIIALALIVAAILNSGIYQMLKADQTAMWRMNRLTGAVSVCVIDGCVPIRERQELKAGTATSSSATPKETPFNMQGFVPESSPTK